MAKQRHFVEIDKLDDVSAGNNYVEPQDSSQFHKQQQSSENITQQPEEQPSQGSNIVNNLGNYESYSGISGEKEEYKPNSQGYTSTGTGVEAAVGTQYSWDKEGVEQAQNQYAQDILSAKQNKLTNRQTIDNNAVNYQVQADMMKYQNNQNAEKVGWTGGYILDLNRQEQYFKQTTQAQLYTAMQLQEAGLWSALESARKAYDLNQKEYAHKYYQEAAQISLEEADRTGVLFSPQVKEMLNQTFLADQNLIQLGAIDSEGNPVAGFDYEKLTAEQKKDYDKAMDVKNAVENWFGENNISKEGVRNHAMFLQDQEMELSWSQEQWKRYYSLIESFDNKFSNDISKFIFLDENGKELWDGTNVATGDWNTLSAKDVGDYVMNGGKLNSYAAKQFYGYIESQIEGPITSGFTKWCLQKGYVKEKDGEYTVVSKIEPSTIQKYLEETGIQHNVLDSYMETFSKDEKYKDLLSNMQNWKFTIESPDKQQFTYTAKDLLSVKKEEQPQQSGGEKEERSQGYGSIDALYVNAKSKDNTWIDNIPKIDISYKFSEMKDAGKPINIQSGIDDDIDYNIDGKTYHLDIDWETGNSIAAHTYGKDSGNSWWDADQTYLANAYSNPSNYDLAFSFVNGSQHLWMWYNGKWGYVQQNVDGRTLYNLVGEKVKAKLKQIQ